MIPPILLAQDNQVRINQTATGTTAGAAQNKKTATDLLLTIVAAPDGANAVGGTTSVGLVGGNTTGAVTNVVSPDKGTLSNVTASGNQNVHYANLQYQYYKVTYSGNATATVNFYTNFAYMNLQDSADQTVA